METEFFAELLASGSLTVRISPGAKHTKVQGKMADGSWKIAIAAPPADGKANAALLQYLKKSGHITAHIQHGQSSRIKLLRLSAPAKTRD